MKDYAIEGDFPYGDAALFQSCPDLPGASTLPELAIYERWTKANEMTKCYILASIDVVLQQQRLPIPITQDIMLNLLRRSLMSKDVLLEILSAEIDVDSQIDIILQSFPNSFIQFRLNYLMNIKHYTLFELMNELQAAEGIIKSKKHILMVSARVSTKLKLKGKKVMKKNKVKHVNKGEAKPMGVQIRDVPKGKVFPLRQGWPLKEELPSFHCQ
ncbi:uncharacterized protein LOC130786441 [Actinidia eriantha]|uniref:uncharacterized protein LOC130786441 n=1 Tax=Actinidia eriantha TaxID=165200 RepID=UPI00258D4B31|nr:uncharacterized protein LOC130786441 [Actinidia eriantha]